MKTDDLIAMLAAGGGAVDPNAARRRYGIALGWGAFGAALLMAILLGVREDLWSAMRLPMFWVKLALPAALAAAALVVVVRLARPGVPLGGAPAALAAPLIAIWILAIVALVTATPGERGELVLGDTWLACLVSISVLSVPAFAGLMWALRGFAPTRPTLTGGAAGLLAGGLAAAIYALHCPEMAAPFLAIWYVLGMAIPTAVGAALGARLLRW
jgi:hypothetical protein